MLAISPTHSSTLQLGGFVEDIASKVGNALKTGAGLLKEFTTIRSEHVVKIELPDAGDIVKRALPAMLLAAITLTGAVYVTRRIVNPNCRV